MLITQSSPKLNYQLSLTQNYRPCLEQQQKLYT